KWSRADTVNYLDAATGLPRARLEMAVDRSAVSPGEAAADILGRNEIWRLRARAEQVLGASFSLPSFHAAILSGGPRPFSLVEADIDKWMTAQLPD
ncbi:MAG: DUF885 family protein, partial [Pseudomonadota bacterium]